MNSHSVNISGAKTKLTPNLNRNVTLCIPISNSDYSDNITKRLRHNNRSWIGVKNKVNTD